MIHGEVSHVSSFSFSFSLISFSFYFFLFSFSSFFWFFVSLYNCLNLDLGTTGEPRLVSSEIAIPKYLSLRFILRYLSSLSFPCSLLILFRVPSLPFPSQRFNVILAVH